MKSIFTYSTKNFMPIILLLVLVFCANVSFGQNTAYDCNNCSSNDISIKSVELVSTTSNPAYPATSSEQYLPLPTSCTSGDPLMGYLKFTVHQNATTR